MKKTAIFNEDDYNFFTNLYNKKVASYAKIAKEYNSINRLISYIIKKTIYTGKYKYGW